MSEHHFLASQSPWLMRTKIALLISWLCHVAFWIFALGEADYWWQSVLGGIAVATLAYIPIFAFLPRIWKGHHRKAFHWLSYVVLLYLLIDSTWLFLEAYWWLASLEILSLLLVFICILQHLKLVTPRKPKKKKY